MYVPVTMIRRIAYMYVIDANGLIRAKICVSRTSTVYRTIRLFVAIERINI